MLKKNGGAVWREILGLESLKVQALSIPVPEHLSLPHSKSDIKLIHSTLMSLFQGTINTNTKNNIERDLKHFASQKILY